MTRPYICIQYENSNGFSRLRKRKKHSLTCVGLKFVGNSTSKECKKPVPGRIYSRCVPFWLVVGFQADLTILAPHTPSHSLALAANKQQIKHNILQNCNFFPLHDSRSRLEESVSESTVCSHGWESDITNLLCYYVIWSAWSVSWRLFMWYVTWCGQRPHESIHPSQPAWEHDRHMIWSDGVSATNDEGQECRNLEINGMQ